MLVCAECGRPLGQGERVIRIFRVETAHDVERVGCAHAYHFRNQGDDDA